MFLAASTSSALRGGGPSIGSCGPTMRAAADTTQFTDRANAAIRSGDGLAAGGSCADVVLLLGHVGVAACASLTAIG
jgi:hypothetical protein